MTQAATFSLEMGASSAPRERVFDAFTDGTPWPPALPRGLRVLEASADARVGGRYRIVMGERDGARHTVAGEYRAVDRADFPAYTDLGGRTAAGRREDADRGDADQRRGRHAPAYAAQRLPRAGRARFACERLALRVQPAQRLHGPRRQRRHGHRAGRSAQQLLPHGTHGTGRKRRRLHPAAGATANARDPAHNPFGRIPVFLDGPISLYETRAILGYIEEAFEGPSLQAHGVTARARDEQWVSVIACHAYDAMVRRYVLQYVFPKGAGGQPDRGVIEAALPDIDRHLAALEQAYGAGLYQAAAARRWPTCTGAHRGLPGHVRGRRGAAGEVPGGAARARRDARATSFAATEPKLA